MTALSNDIVIDAPADTVWQVIAHEFDRIGNWATAIPASHTLDAVSAVGAPVAGRVCQTGLRMAPAVSETVVAYDETGRTLTYEATDGIPAFVTLARNQWQVTALDERRSRVSFDAELQVRGMLGKLFRWWLLLRVGRDGKHLLDDLKHYVEHSTPSPRKAQRG
jgi:hypothetical protein